MFRANRIIMLVIYDMLHATKVKNCRIISYIIEPLSFFSFKNLKDLPLKYLLNHKPFQISTMRNLQNIETIL